MFRSPKASVFVCERQFIIDLLVSYHIYTPIMVMLSLLFAFGVHTHDWGVDVIVGGGCIFGNGWQDVSFWRARS